MKGLKEYILENLDDNIFWLLDRWFERDEISKQEFLNIIYNCQNDKSTNNLETYINQTNKLKNELISLINFVNDDTLNNVVNSNEECIYQLQKIIKVIIDNKQNNYNKGRL